MSHPVITLTSDLGDGFAPSQIELVVHSINPDIKFIHGENSVTPFSIIEGGFILSKFYGFAPKGSIHLTIIDPGVGSDRKGLIIKTKSHWFIGPDNGVLYPASVSDGIEEAFIIDESKSGSLSNTFHGRDIFAKTAAWISLGRSLAEFTKPYAVDDIIKLSFDKNQIVHIDPYGNIKLHAKPNGYKVGEKIRLKLKDKEVHATYCKTFADVPEGEVLLYPGSHQTLELAINQRSAAEYFESDIGDVIQI